MKFLFKAIVKLFVFVLILAVLAVAGAFGYYHFTKIDVESFLSQDYAFHAEIESISSVYRNVLDLPAAETVLSDEKFSSIRKMFNDFRTSSMGRNPILTYFLELECTIHIDKERNVILAVDLKQYSLLTKIFPILNHIFRIENLDINTFHSGEHTYYEILLSQKNKYYASLRENIFLFAPQKETLVLADLINESTVAKHFYTPTDLAKNFSQRAQIRCFLDTEFLSPVFASFGDALPIVPDQNAACSIYITESDLDLDIFVPISCENEAVLRFLEFSPYTQDISPLIPHNANAAFSFKINSVKEFYDAFLQFQGEESRRKIEKSVSMLSLLNLTFEEAVNWIGNEIGAFYVGRNNTPVVFFEIQDEMQKNLFLKRLTDSMVFKEDNSLVLNSVLIRRIALPDFFQALLQPFVKNLNLVQPYYIESGGVIFFSPEAENLLHVVAASRDGKSLSSLPAFKAISTLNRQNSSSKSSLLAYYDTQRIKPTLFASNKVLGTLSELYSNGIISAAMGEQAISINIALKGSKKETITVIPGFPKQFDENLVRGAKDSEVFVGELRGSDYRKTQTIFINSAGILTARDMENKDLLSFETAPHSQCRVINDDSGGIVAVFTPPEGSQPGLLQVLDGNFKPKKSFPLVLPENCRIFPAYTNGEFWFFDGETRKLKSISPKSGRLEEFPVEFPDEEILDTVYADDLHLLCAPQSIFGDVYLYLKNGDLQQNWPCDGGGNVVTPPQIAEGRNPKVIFLAQNGILSMWDLEGNPAEGFPVDLDGNFLCKPMVFNYNKDTQGIFTVNTEGMARVVSFEGEVIAEYFVKGQSGDSIRISKADVDKDAADEIFIYGASDTIFAFDGYLQTLDGFPVAGNTCPQFTDFDGNKKPEMFTFDFLGNLHGYELNF